MNVLVQLAFAGPPEVRHLDGDRTNNRPENLEYGSHWRNEQDKRGLRDGKERDGLDGWGATLPALVVTSPVTRGPQ